MQPQKQNFLQVSYDKKRGLKLSWNFKDLSIRQKYLKHIFVICSENEAEIHSMLQVFYKKMKFGDLFCCVFAHSKEGHKVGKWVEKSQLQQFKPSRYMRRRSQQNLNWGTKLKLLDEAGTEAKQFSESVLISLLLDEKDDPAMYEEEIHRRRLSHNETYQYVVNMFGQQLESKISVHHGINQFGGYGDNFEPYGDYYNKIMNAAVVETAKVTIEAVGGQLTLYNEIYWRQIDFNRIQTNYYGPSSKFEYDQIYLFQQDQTPHLQQELQIRLEITLFSKLVLRNVKRVKVMFNMDKGYFPTLQLPRSNAYYPVKGLSLAENPYMSQIVAKLATKKEEPLK